MPESGPQPRVEPASACAAIDIGTNSVKLIVADVSAEGTAVLHEESTITRLGEGMNPAAPRLSEPAMARTLAEVVKFTEVARAHGAHTISPVGTAALREASNGPIFVRRVRDACGLEVKLITGAEEARLSYLAVRRDSLWREAKRLLVVDVGGGSTEFIAGLPGSDAIAWRVSVRIGAVRLTDLYIRADPPTINELTAASNAARRAFEERVEPRADLAGSPRPTVVGVGGTLTNLASVDLNGARRGTEVHGHILTREAIESQITRFACCTLDERRRIAGLDPARADIIVAGAILVQQALTLTDAETISVSARGLRWGVLYDICIPQ